MNQAPKDPPDTAPVIEDASSGHWVYRAPNGLRPYLQLSRLDRPVGYWLLTLPGWIGLAFAALSARAIGSGIGGGFSGVDLKWATLILIGAVAMRGAGCTYNDIVDQDLDKQVKRTALRPLPAGAVSTAQAWIWLMVQCGIGLIVLLCLPRPAQIISLCSLPLVAAYPFMKRITWWPQLWLGLTFNWALLVAYAAKTGAINGPLLLLYVGLAFWTVGYDTIYACQDTRDDALIGVKSTARRFGRHVLRGIFIFYAASALCIGAAVLWALARVNTAAVLAFWPLLLVGPAAFLMHLLWQVRRFKSEAGTTALSLFISNIWAAALLIAGFSLTAFAIHGKLFSALALNNP